MQILIFILYFYISCIEVIKSQEVNQQYLLHHKECPRIYIYDTGHAYYGKYGYEYNTYLKTGVDMVSTYGSKCDCQLMNHANKSTSACLDSNGIYATKETNLVQILLYRVFHSKRCILEKDPLKAELYFIPMYPGMINILIINDQLIIHRIINDTVIIINYI